ncbi:AsmA family protein [Ancylobacter sp. A5.8]|uniref:AsmA family protein n=1 Tax=Ancylobacter gelatini TaxID=2919920 RepID=UPI001F4E6E61|nr:AsmA family protein [Ancylobacter gelatini]MCJ8143742.1 AsmA family protein [Ancylobacter gelatini]
MKKLAPILLLPVLLALVAAALAPKLASEARLRAEAQVLLSAAAGHEARIEGPVRFSAFPWPALTIDGLTVGDPTVATLETSQARIVLDLLPLLTGQTKADHIELHEPVLTLADREDELGALTALLHGLGRSRLRADVSIYDGRILRMVDGEAREVLGDTDLDLSWRGGDRLSIGGHLIWRDEPLDVELNLSGLAALAEDVAGELQVKLSGPPGQLSFGGTMRLASSPVIEGALECSSRGLRATLDWLDLETPTEQGFGPFALSAHTLLTAQGATLSGARIELDGNVSEGGFTLRSGNGRTGLQGSFASASVDLSPYGQPVLAEPDGGAWSRETIKLDRLKDLDVDLRFSAAQVHAGTTRLDKLAASAVLKAGKLTLAIGDSEAWQGTFRATAQIAPLEQGTDVRVELAGEDVSLAQALGDLFRSQRLEGTGSFRINLGASGASIAELVGRLGGSASLTGTQGALTGIDVSRILSRLEQRPLSGVGDLRGGRTPYDTIDFSAQIHEGIAHVEHLNIESTKLRIELNGDADLARRDLDLEGTAQLVRAAEPAAFDLPFMVRGSWERPVLLPDPQALIRRSGAARPLFGGKLDTFGVAAPLP